MSSITVPLMANVAEVIRIIVYTLQYSLWLRLVHMSVVHLIGGNCFVV